MPISSKRCCYLEEDILAKVNTVTLTQIYVYIYIYCSLRVRAFLLACRQPVLHDVILVGRVAPPCCSGCTNGGMDVVVALL